MPNGKVADVIVLAGENGSGKTKLIEYINTVSSHLSFIDHSQQSHQSETHIILHDDTRSFKCLDQNNNEQFIDEIHFFYPTNEAIPGGRVIFKHNGQEYSNIIITNSNERLRNYRLKTIYSSVNINYKPLRQIDSVTNETLDQVQQSLMRADDLAHDVIQLLVDIKSQDNQDLATWIENNPGQAPPESVQHNRLQRFTNAFPIVFGEILKFQRIEQNSIPVFKKNGREIAIQDLSSGEKQIIFRGVQLLRDKESMSESIVLVDEPELSMHPKWERLIFNYYKQICSKANRQSSQLFMVTHSEHVLENALNDDGSIIIKMPHNNTDATQTFYKNGSGQILPTITIGEIKFSIFELYTTDFHISLYGALQDLTGRTSIDGNNGIDRWLLDHGAPRRQSHYGSHHYETLPTLIRNHIDHPDNNYTYTDDEFRQSINFLIEKAKEITRSTL